MPVRQKKRGKIYAASPFDFAKSLDYLRQFPPPALYQAVEENSFMKAFRLEGQTLLASVSSGGDPEQLGLDYEIFSSQRVSNELESALVDRLCSFLSLDDNLGQFYSLAADDPQFQPIVEALFGYHLVKFQSPFEAAVWAILSQRNRMTTARNMFRGLVDRFGYEIKLEGITCRAFPEPQDIAGCNEGDLTFVARNLRRGEFLLDAARAFAMVPPGFLTTAEYPEVESWLRGITGIGPWSASFILLRGLGRSETVPLPDQRFLDAASRVYGAGLTLETSEVLRIAKRYHPWQGYWAHYLRIAA